MELNYMLKAILFQFVCNGNFTVNIKGVNGIKNALVFKKH